MSQLQFIDQQRRHYSVQVLCQVLNIVPSRQYAWRKGVAAGAMVPTEPAWEMALAKVFDAHQRRYGVRNLRVELRSWQRQAVRTACRYHERKAPQYKAFVPRTTDSTHGKQCTPNLLLDQPRPTQANCVWVSNITYLALANGNWVYCCAFQDICTKQVVGWQMRADMLKALVTNALQWVLLAQRPAPELDFPR